MTRLPELHGRLIPEQSRTIRDFTVEVPAGAKQLVIDLGYDPRTVVDRDVALGLVRRLLAAQGAADPADGVLERFWPLRNLLNVGLYDPRGRFRGRWDRNRPEQPSRAAVAETGSDPGMMDGAIVPGTWHVCLEVHQVLVPVDYELRIAWSEEPPPAKTETRKRGNGETRWGTSGELGILRTPDSGPRTPWLKGELHVHTEHSDGRQSVRDVAAALAADGLDFFALTDHNTTSSWRELPDNLPVLRGLELTTFYGHATCLGIREFVPWYAGERLRPLREMAAEVHAAGGVLSAAHPFSPPNPLCAGCRWEFPDARWDDVDLLEVWNGDLHEHQAINTAAMQLWDRLLSEGRRIPAVAGSDMHDVEHLKTKRYARTFVRAAGPTPQAILHALRRGRTMISAGPVLRLEAEAGDRNYAVGDTVVTTPGGTVAIRGTVDAPEAVRTHLVVAGRRVHEGRTCDYTLRTDTSTWVRAEARLDDTLLAVTNPIYVDVNRDA